MLISKSEYMLYLKHPAWLWIKKHAKHLMPPIDEALQARFDEGHAFEPFVEALYPNLVRLGFNSYSEYLEMPDKTAEAWDFGAEVVSQGRYESGSITCISDIVRRDGDAFILTEIKIIIAAKIKAFSACCPLKVTALPETIPCNFPNAIKLPEKVKVPINTLRQIIKLKSSILKNSEDATKADAAPPKPLKIATI